MIEMFEYVKDASYLHADGCRLNMQLRRARECSKSNA